MKELIEHPWIKVLLIATTVAMCSFALRETASITMPMVNAITDVAVPVAIGFVIAYVLTPVVDLISRRSGFGRTLAAATLFGLTGFMLIGTMVLVVPLLAKQSADLVNQIARGETYVDSDRNGRWDVGEPFSDMNGNGIYDPSVITRIGDWVQSRQQSLKRMANLTVDEPGLALLTVYQEETRVPRVELERLLAGGNPSGLPAKDAPLAWNPIWPGPLESEIEAVVSKRPQLAPHLYAIGHAWFDAHRRFLVAVQTVRGGPDVADLSALIARLRAVSATRLEVEPHASAMAAVRKYEEAEHNGSLAARELLTVLRGGESGFGSQAVALGMTKIEEAARRTLDQIPDRLGGWAESLLGNAGAISGFLLDLLLIPIYAFFLILAMPHIRSGLKQIIPITYRDHTLRIVREIERAVSAFFRGRLIICLICSLVGVGGFLALQMFGVKVPYGILFGVMLGMVTPIPLAGIAVALPALAMTMIQPGAGPLQIALVVGVYGAVQATEAVLIPWILGREVEIHPVWLIVALLLCGKLFGVLGLILAVPIAATVRILGREYLLPRLRNWAAKGVAAVQPPPEEGPSS
ncbi:MAG: AI-2E family transporter [Planctomycetota bacterium]